MPWKEQLGELVALPVEVEAPAFHFLGELHNLRYPGSNHFAVIQAVSFPYGILKMHLGVIPRVGVAETDAVSPTGYGGIAGGIRAFGDDQDLGPFSHCFDGSHGPCRPASDNQNVCA